MTRAKRALSMLLVAGLVLTIGAPGASATSAVPEPGAFGFPINPNASGTKVSGPMSLAYDIHEDPSCDSARRVENILVVATFGQGGNTKLFNRALDPAASFCFGVGTPEIQLVTALISQQVVPHFFSCVAATCPAFEVKSITDFLSSGTGAFTVDLTIAVH